ncbi:transposase, IS4 family [Thalassoporum mexicanum PCC 7367]|uniref:IS5 family transposase n=1 Tax=Thalassoporum mexicanum TaxID=3457544 RepID=UPI00029FFD6C|nr:IS5 family transposase [Pseudanabaena sp. PCC 7367]AFY71380.1 transposase, IS4 family [Pseudanabaena sp. PCC 7367]
MKKPPQYRVRNWQEYNKSLKQRGSLIFWISKEAIEMWLEPERSGNRGASNRYSDQAIATIAMLKSIYGLAGRQVTGLVESLFTLMNIDLPVPDHSTVSRRMGKLAIELPHQKTQAARHVVVDSTGVKVYGEGEWKTRQHGIGKRRTWRKIHLGVDESSGEILAAAVTSNQYHDGQILPELLNQIEDEIKQVSGDGAYDHRDCYDAISARQAQSVIPPRKNAKIWQHGNCKAPPHPRDQNLRRIRKVGRAKWKRETGYHRRSLAETTMFRLKTIFGGKLRSRNFDNQAVELFLQCVALNRIMMLCKPDSYLVED